MGYASEVSVSLNFYVTF
uniref:Uncharacterized protein n=1 Tax=Arundo donax TaxID=35708 RepID=A0A0A9ACB5_ARUDO